jgi:7-keto-8-aminopelargonate synthetase-like enzyme
MLKLENSISNYIYLENKRYSFFGGNNYLGLANHPSLIRSAINSIQKYGINFSASRQTTGTSILHLELEKLLSEFKNKKDSVVYASGYLGNRILLDALKNQYSAVFLDELSHPSIIDGIPSGIPKVIYYNHCDPLHLEILLKKNRKFRPLIITDGVFSLTGEIAPLSKIYPVAERYNALLIVDDAHATGVLGENGRGTPEFFHLDDAANIYQSETLSKALGAYGGFISAGEEIVSTIREKSNIYLASTSLPPPIVSAACSALMIIRQQPGLRTALFENIKDLKEGVKRLNFHSSPDYTPIIPLMFTSQKNAKNISDFLKENYIIVPYITYPLKMNKFIVRITVSAIHTKAQIEELLVVLKQWRKKNGSNKD